MASLTLSSAVAAQALEDPTRLPEISVTATRTERATDDVPATVTTTTADEMERGLVHDLRDLIRYEPNVSADSDPNRFGAAGFNIRGLTDNRVLLQIDGIRLPDYFRFSIGPLNTASRNLVDLESLKRVEILRGPASSLYGSDALGGVVTYLTKDPADYLRAPDASTYASLKSGYASVDDSWTNTLTAAGGNQLLSALAVLTLRDGHERETQGTDDSVGPTRTVANPQGYHSWNALFKIVAAPSPRHRLRLTYEQLESDVDTNVLSLNFSTPRTSALLGDDEFRRQRASLDYEYTNPQGGSLAGLRWSAYWQRGEATERTDETRTNTTAGCSGALRGVNTCFIPRLFTFEQTVTGTSVQAESRLEAGASLHRILYGFDVSRTESEELRDATIFNLTTGTVTNMLAGDTFPARDFPPSRTRQIGVFLQDEIALWDGQLDLIPGLRYDHYDLKVEPDAIFNANASPTARVSDFTDSAVSPKIGAIWRFASGASVYTTLATGFRAPPFDDLNQSFRNPIQSYAIIPNPDLQSEQSRGIEVGARGDTGRANFAAAVFYNRYKDFIEPQARLDCPADPRCVPEFLLTFQSINRTNVRIWGAEARGEYRFARGWSALGAVGYARGDDLDRNVPINSINPLKGVAGLQYDAPGRAYGAAATVTAVAKKTHVDDTQQPQTPLFRTPGFAIVDLTGYWQPHKQVTLTAGVFNLFDRKYWLWADIWRVGIGPNTVAPPAASLDRFTQPGRNFAVSIKIAL